MMLFRILQEKVNKRGLAGNYRVDIYAGTYN
jgi:hypothetical protein